MDERCVVWFDDEILQVCARRRGVVWRGVVLSHPTYSPTHLPTYFVQSELPLTEAFVRLARPEEDDDASGDHDGRAACRDMFGMNDESDEEAEGGDEAERPVPSEHANRCVSGGAVRRSAVGGSGGRKLEENTRVFSGAK